MSKPADTAASAASRPKLPIVFILITILLDAMGIGLIMPVMPQLIQEVQGSTLANAAIWGGVLTTSYAVMQFLCGPVLGGLSDAYGRRPVLLLSLLFMAFDYLIMALAGSMWLLLVGRVMGGITAATYAAALAYIADISRSEDKAANFGLMGAAFGIGFVLGPLIGGVLGEYGTRAPFYAAAILSALNLLLGLFVLKETVTDRIRRPFRWANANPLGAFRMVSQLPNVRRLMAAFFVYSVAVYVYPAIWAYYTQASFGWDAGMIGVSLAVYGISAAAVQMGLIRLLLRWWGERGTILFGLLIEALACACLGVIGSGLLALALTPVAAIGAVVEPALKGVMSQRVNDDMQGALQGVLASASALAMIVSPLAMTFVFAGFTREGAAIHLPGAPFLLAALLVLLSLFLSRQDRMDGS